MESWASAFCLKLAWKTATLLTLVTAKHCSDLPLLHIDNQHPFFFSVMLPFSFPCLVARQIAQVIFPLRFILSLIPMLIFALFFYLKAYLRHTESFRMKTDGSHVTSLFFGNNRQHQPVCAETISSWVRKVLCVVKTHMSLVSLWGIAASAALATGVSLMAILQVGDWARVPTPARLYFSTYITTTVWHQDSVLCWALVSRSSPGKCQTLTYTQSCICWAVRL